ncbi:MAG: NUDIX domain-containing protein [Clostridia bacterium]|nr:NUDIX domain-containing protein [Clostridia bacterium]MBO5669952.1 NUDIX domain-containing protein [Clostridia bacterium]
MEEIRSRYGQYASLLGREVDVVVNRPLGSYPLPYGESCPTSGNGQNGKRRKRYPVNCGYITTDLSDLYPPQNPSSGRFNVGALPPRYVYILGVEEPLETFRGRIIAVVRRSVRTAPPQAGAPVPQYSYDRLIVAPEGVELYEPEIRHAISFAERRGKYRLYCMYEKSCGAVVYTVHDGTPLYLLIRNRSGHIGFPKGHVEFGEDERATMMREIREETSLCVEPDLSFREEYNYILWGVVHKRAVYSMGRFTFGDSVTTMENEIFGDWLVPIDEARRLLSYDNDRNILERAHSRILMTLSE